MNKSEKKVWIIALCLTCLFSLCFGYYFSYRVNEKEKTKLEIIQEIMENEWYYGVEDEDISNTLENKMILSLQDPVKDPYTKYLTSLGSLADSYTGIGVTIHAYGDYYIISEISSKATIDAGVKVNDLLVSINGVDLKGKTIEDIQSMITNKSNVALGLVRDGSLDPNNKFTINVPVKSYEPITVFTKEYENTSYVQITEFNSDTAEYIRNYFETLNNELPLNLIIDLRGNPGGYISAVQQVLDIFVRANKVVMYTEDKHGSISTVKTIDDDDYLFEKIYVLIDNNSASGAEALAAAMDYHLNNVVLYGDTTFGKGSAQKTYHFEDGTYFHYTYAIWKTPANKTINHIGVVPSVMDVNTGISSVDLYEEEYKLYDYGKGVKSLQIILSKLGLYTGPIHSFFDEETRDALIAFQTNNGLTPTGKYDAATLGFFAKLIYDDKLEFQNNQLETVLGLIG